LHDHPKFKLIYGDLGDSTSINNILREILPDEIYNLGAQSHVRISFDIPEYTADIDGVAVTRLLEAIRKIKEKDGKNIRLYQASTSELFGKTKEIPQKETTPFYPRSPYACAKLYAYWMCKNYRESYGIFVCNGILFNHESPRRGENFVTKKIISDVVKIKEGLKDNMYLGNLNAQRDWGHAKDYVYAMWLIMQQATPEDFVVATGETHSVREFLEEAFRNVGIIIKSNGLQGIEEEYIRTDTNQVVVKIDSKFFRPTEVDMLIGDYTKIKNQTGWVPKILFKDLVKEMINHEQQELQNYLYGKNRDLVVIKKI
jgi:GDPmannose 4,6-dehydratase